LIRIADPSLVVLVGASGSGKSTLAARLFSPDEVLSSDGFRALIAGDPADQRATRRAFAALHRELDRRLAAGRLVAVDATSVTAFARRGLVRRARARGIPAIAIVLDLDERLVRARNATRPGRIVPDAIVTRQLGDLGHSLRRGLDNEGFAQIRVLRSAKEVDDLAIEWIGEARIG
jgi:protein phosphatase